MWVEPKLNVATALANWHVPVKYSTVLPQNSLADDVVNYVAQLGIDPSGIARFGQRIGSYFLPQGTDLKNAGVIYDRAHSAFSELTVGRVDWAAVLQDTSWLHVSAISPALSASVAAACLELVTVASAMGITISIDLNHRARLWQYGQSPTNVMPALVEHCDVVMGNLWAANALLGIPVDEDIHHKGQQADYLAHAQTHGGSHSETLSPLPSGGQHVPVRCAARWTSVLHHPVYRRSTVHFRRSYETDSVVDRVGSGDCFMAGLIYGLYNQHAPQAVVDFAATAAFGKLQELG